MDRSHVVFPFDSVIDEYSTAKSGELLCTLQEEQEESAANVGVRARKRDKARPSDVKRRLFGFTVMIACLIYYEIWNVVPKLLRELEEDRHVVRSRSESA